MTRIMEQSIHSGHWIDFRLGVSHQFKIKSCVHINFYIIVINRIKSNLIKMSDEYQIVDVEHHYKHSIVYLLVFHLSLCYFHLWRSMSYWWISLFQINKLRPKRHKDKNERNLQNPFEKDNYCPKKKDYSSYFTIKSIKMWVQHLGL